MIADSESGVSKTRSSPNLRCKCSVTRKTPPLAPISCPSKRTRLSRSNSRDSDELRASIMVICMKINSQVFNDAAQIAHAYLYKIVKFYRYTAGDRHAVPPGDQAN